MLIIRPERPEDEAEIRHVNEEAFGQKEEAEIIEKLRSRRPSLWIVLTTITEL
jgi:predicted N-acetyltransferase YhbS